MVYRGQPSKACLLCRKRKLRCDQKKGACGQCTRANLVCSGYRDTEQLRVRDETQTTKRKVLSRALSTVPQPLVTTIDDRARNVFFAYYISGLSPTHDVLEPLYTQSPADTPIIASVDAVSLAFFSVQFDCTQASHDSRKRYLSALPLLNKALRMPGSASSDSTLLAVFLLDLYEKITNNNPRSIGSWMSHINGALALVGLREEPLHRDYTGLWLSTRLSSNLLLSYLCAKSPVPPAVLKFRSGLEPFLNEDPKWRLSGLAVKYAELKGAIQDGCLHSSEIIARATKLDLEYVSLAKQMPATWLYRTIHLEEASERVLGQHYDTYLDPFITKGWNGIRIIRVLLNDIIRAECSSRGTKTFNNASSYRSSSVALNYIDDMAKEICATVPQFTGHVKSKQRGEDYCTTQKFRCYTLLFPLYVAGSYASSTTQIKPWIVKQLRFMSGEMGIRNASVVAEILEGDDRICPWDVYTLLGSYAFTA